MKVFERLAQVANDIEKLFTGSLFLKIISNKNSEEKPTFLIKNFYVRKRFYIEFKDYLSISCTWYTVTSNYIGLGDQSIN